MTEHHLLLIGVYLPVSKHTQTMRSTFPLGLFIHEGGGWLLFDVSFNWCMYWSDAWALLWTGRPYT